MTNPIFESAGSWDLLCDISGGRLVVGKDIHTAFPSASAPPTASRFGLAKGETFSSGDELPVRDATVQSGAKSEFVNKSDNSDNAFMEDVSVPLFHFSKILGNAG